jgi:threonine dehydratase
MPENTPKIKINAVRMFGGEHVKIVQVGTTFDTCFTAANKFCEENNLVFCHPYDNDKVIEGQATIAVEIFEDFEGDGEIDYIIVPIGGGGLSSGIVSYVSQVSPTTKVVGCEPLGCPSMKIALETKKIQPLTNINPFVDGAAVGNPGKKCFEILR